MPKQLKFWNLVKNEEEKTAELILYGSIGSDEYWDDISDKVFKQDIENLGDVENITLHINSPGGSVYTAIAINNALRRHKAKVTVNIDGIAASAATLITCAGDTVRMPKNALFMIHNPLTIAMGDSEEMRKQADVLEKHKNSILETYLQKVNIDKEKLSELMDNETWMDAEMAKDYGFVDEIVDEEVGKEFVENKLIINNMAFDISKFKNFRKVKGVVINNKKNTKEVKMTLDELKNQFPDLYDYVLNEGKKIGKEEERERIKAIDDIGVNNYSDLIENAKYVNPMSASELAINILKKQKEEKAQKLQNIKNESQGNFIPPAANDGTTHGKKEEKQFMGLDIMTIFSKMNKKTEEGK